MSLHNEDQEGSGLDHARAQLNAACDHTQKGELVEAWVVMENTRPRGAMAEQFRKAVAYIHNC